MVWGARFNKWSFSCLYPFYFLIKLSFTFQLLATLSWFTNRKLNNEFCSHISSEISYSEVTVDVLTDHQTEWTLTGAFYNSDHVFLRILSLGIMMNALFPFLRLILTMLMLGPFSFLICHLSVKPRILVLMTTKTSSSSYHPLGIKFLSGLSCIPSPKPQQHPRLV